MKITRSQACHILGVTEGASLEEIRSRYRDLARKWHPDKQDGTVGTDEATRKFQEVSAAYKKLTTNDRDSDDDGMTLSEMMELYRQLFTFGNSMNQCNCLRHRHPIYSGYNGDLSDDEYDYSEEEECDEDFWKSIASRLRNKYEAKKYMQKDTADIPTSKITEEEALRNAQELIEEEEIEKRRKEKKKAKKKKKKEKRKQKDKDSKSEDDQAEIVLDEKAIDREQEEKPKADSSTTNLTNGHATPIKINTKNTQYKNHNRGIDNMTTENMYKPIKRVIVQEDIRPSIAKETKKDKAMYKGQNQRTSNNKKDSSDDEDQFDASSAFFARAASKAPQGQLAAQPPPPKEPVETKIKKDPVKKNGLQKSKEIYKPANNTKERKEENKNIDTKTEKNSVEIKKECKMNENTELNSNIDNVVIQSRQLAVKGNDFAAKEEYIEAIKMFTEAIKLDPTDFRFFGNRSYCYDRTAQYEKALKDAESATALAPHWPKGYFRKGRALIGQQRYQEAEEAFQHVLKLDADCPDAQFELAKVRIRMLTDMGFDATLARESIRTHGTVQSALEALLAGNVTPRSDGEDTASSTDTSKNSVTQNGNIQSEKSPVLVTTQTSAKPQQKCTALWVGNVCAPHVTDKQLTQLFSKYGKTVGVRLLPEKYCAFVNFQSAEDASNALENLQGVELGGQHLLIRYPNNPPPGSVVYQEKSSVATTSNKKSVDKGEKSKVTGPVNGNECYFWRTTGCVFDKNCRYRHVAHHKGVDLAKVQAKYGNCV